MSRRAPTSSTSCSPPPPLGNTLLKDPLSIVADWYICIYKTQWYYVLHHLKNHQSQKLWLATAWLEPQRTNSERHDQKFIKMTTTSLRTFTWRRNKQRSHSTVATIGQFGIGLHVLLSAAGQTSFLRKFLLFQNHKEETRSELLPVPKLYIERWE